MWLYVTLGVIVVLGFAVATFQVWTNDNALRDRGRRTSARVVEIGTGKKNRVHVEFTTEQGRRVEALVGQGDEAPGARVRVGDEIPVVYDTENPTDDVRDARAPQNHKVAYLLLGVTIAGAVALPFTSWGLHREHRRRRQNR
nr:DUF3592 domain-containing protein [uncultured Actinoplanes sp.]